MAVNRRHIEFTKNFLKWQRVRHVLEGEDAVKAAGEAYLPRLEKESDERYFARKQRGVFFNASGRTLDGLHGYIWRRDPEVENPGELDQILDNVTLTGVSLYEAMKTWSREQLSVGRFGILVDMPQGEAQRAYLAFYRAEDIINWRTEVIDGVNTVTLVVLRETANIQGDDEFETKFKERYRVLKLTDAGYVQDVWESDGNDTAQPDQVWAFVNGLLPAGLLPSSAQAVSNVVSPQGSHNFTKISSVTPVIRGSAMEFIPFVFVNVSNLEAGIEKSPLEDVITLNLAHYRTSVDLEHGRHMTALPTPVFCGFDPKDQINLGPSEAIVSSQTNAKAEFLEFTGSGLNSLEKSLTEKENQMAILGAKLLEGQKKAAEAAETVKLRQGGDVSVLTQIVITLGLGFERALTYAAQMMGVQNPDVSVDVNTEFVQPGLAGSDLLNLIKAWQEGGISRETLLYNLKRAEVIPPAVTVEMEMKAIEKEQAEKAANAPEVTNTDAAPGMGAGKQEQTAS